MHDTAHAFFTLIGHYQWRTFYSVNCCRSSQQTWVDTSFEETQMLSKLMRSFCDGVSVQADRHAPTLML